MPWQDPVGRYRSVAQPLDDRGVGHPAALANRRQRIVSVAPLELVQRRQDEPRATRAQWVTKRDRATIDVQPIEADAKLFLPGQADRCERLVDLEQVNIVDRHARALQNFARGRDGPAQHHHWVRADLGEPDESRPRSYAQLFSL